MMMSRVVCRVVLLSVILSVSWASLAARDASAPTEILEVDGVDYRVLAAWSLPERRWSPVAAQRLDRDADGNAELLVAYAAGDGGWLTWIPVHGSVAGAAERALRLSFAPQAMVTGDFDADGRPEALLADADLARLAVLAFDERGTPVEPRWISLPARARSLRTEDRPRRDGLPEVVVELADDEAVRRLVAGSAVGALAALAAREWSEEGAAESSQRTTRPDVLLATRLDADAHPELLVVLADGSLVLLSETPEATITVTSTAEAVDFGGAQQVGDLPGADGLVTLPEAIIAANNTAGADLVSFNIPSAGNDCHDGACWITPSDGEAGPLPAITESLTLDGYTQTTNRGDTNPNGPELVLEGSGLASGNGLSFQGAAASAVVDLVVAAFPGAGIDGNDADGLTVKGCYLGTTLDGSAAAGNGTGIRLAGGTTGAVVGGTGTHGTSPLVPDRCLVSGNGEGILVEGDGTGANSVVGSYLGTDRTGSGALPNDSNAVRVATGPEDTTIGGTAAGAGNLISGNAQRGVAVEGEGTTGTLVQGNVVGASAAGTSAIANYQGIVIVAGADDTLVGGTSPSARNLVSGNTLCGVIVGWAGTTGTLIEGNWVGLDSTGAVALANGDCGVHVGHAGDPSSDTTVGGAGSGAGNVISGNAGNNVELFGVTGTSVLGNRIGTNAAGTAALGGGWGVVIGNGANANDIGGPGVGEGNLISGNDNYGVKVIDAGSSGNRVRGNWIGVDATGSAPLGNQLAGVGLYPGAAANEIGGPAAGEGNWIAASPSGVEIAGASGTLVRGNRLGVAPVLRAPGRQGGFGNGQGILVKEGATGTVIGGAGGEANEIVDSSYAGVTVRDSATVGVRISRNSIHANGGLAVDLGEDGVTPNDPGDPDSGPNDLVNYPVLASATTVCGGSTTITGTVDTPNVDSGLVELFASTVADPSGYGEGQTYLGPALPAFDGSFTTVVPAQPAGSFVTASFTDTAGSTSELSAAVVVRATPFAPSALAASLAAGPGAALAWVDNASDETQFRVERRQAGNPSFALLVNLPANATTYTDNGPLAAGSTYYYRVRAEKGACLSEWSNVASLLVPGAATPFCRTRATHHRSAQNPFAAAASSGVFGLVWRELDGDAASLLYARLDGSGATVAGPVVVRASGEQIAGPILAWDGGNRFGVAWYERLGDRWELFFSTVDLDGRLLTGPIPVAEPDGFQIVNQMQRSGLAWDGAGWGVVWPDGRTGYSDVRFVHVAADGASTETADVLVSDGGAGVSAYGPRIAWNGIHHAVVWFDSRSGTLQLHLRSLGRDGTPVGASGAVTTGAVIRGLLADLAWDGASELGLAWGDDRDGLPGVYFRRLSTTGVPLSPESRIADGVAQGAGQYQLSLARSANRWVVAAEDWRDGDLSGVEIRMCFADPVTGAKVGPDVLVSAPLDAFFSDHPAVAWDGSRLVVAWHDTALSTEALEVHLQAMDETGNPGTNPRRVVTSGHSPASTSNYPPVVEALGNGLAVAWLDDRAGDRTDVYLRLFDGSGAPVSGEIVVSDGTVPAAAGVRPSLAWSGEVLGALWQDGVDYVPMLSFLDASGSKLRPDVPLPLVALGAGIDLLWTGERFLVAFEESGGAENGELVTAAYLPDGTADGGPSRISEAAGRSIRPSLSGDGAARAVTWQDNRSGSYAIYAAALDERGARVGPEVLVSPAAVSSARPSLSWSGSQFGLAWRGAAGDVRFRRLAADATPAGAEIQLGTVSGGDASVASDGSGWGVAWWRYSFFNGAVLGRVGADGVQVGLERLALYYGSGANLGSGPALAWDGASFVVAALDMVYMSGEVSLKTSPCIFDDTPPSCPSGLGATVLGHSVALSWTPGVDADFAVERQPVERDGERIAALAPGVPSYLDRQVSEGVRTYRVGTLNQGYLEASGCPTLEVTVPDPDALFYDGFESGDASRWSGAVP